MSQTRDINVVSTLTRKRNDIEARIEGYQAEIRRCEADLAVVSATLAIFEREGDYRPGMSLSRLFKRGEAFKVACEALQAAGKPLDTRELARALAVHKGLDPEDRVLCKALVANVIHTLTHREKRGHIRRDGKRDGVVLWAT